MSLQVLLFRHSDNRKEPDTDRKVKYLFWQHQTLICCFSCIVNRWGNHHADALNPSGISAMQNWSRS